MKIPTILSAILSLILASTAFAQESQNFGWTPNPKATEEFVQTLPAIYGEQVKDLIVEDNNKDALLYRALIPCLEKHGAEAWLKERNGKKCVRSYNQGSVGSCVGNAAACVASVLNAVEVVIVGEPQEFRAMHSADGMYGIGREAANMLRPGDGCSGSGMARGVLNIGTLYCIKYGDVDLTVNTPSRARQYGTRGVGSALKNEAAKTKITSTVRVRSAQEAWALIGNGYPINVCSGYGYRKQRDGEGICQPSGSWNHAMSVVARRTAKDGRKLFLIWNSWGDNWCGGPYWDDMPWGSFWIEWKHMDGMLSRGDSFAYGGLDGFKARSLEHFGTKDFLGQIEVNHEIKPVTAGLGSGADRFHAERKPNPFRPASARTAFSRSGLSFGTGSAKSKITGLLSP